MLVVFSPIFVTDTTIVSCYNFGAHLRALLETPQLEKGSSFMHIADSPTSPVIQGRLSISKMRWLTFLLSLPCSPKRKLPTPLIISSFLVWAAQFLLPLEYLL